MGGDLNLKVRQSSMSSSSNSPVHVNTFPTFDFPFVWKRPKLAQYRSALPFTHLHGATHMDQTLAFGINSCLIRATKQLPDHKGWKPPYVISISQIVIIPHLIAPYSGSLSELNTTKTNPTDFYHDTGRFIVRWQPILTSNHCHSTNLAHISKWKWAGS